MGSAALTAQGAIAVRRRHMADMASIACCRDIGARQMRHGGGVAVIGVIRRDDPALARHRLGHPQGDVIRLGPGADHDRGLEVMLERRRQPLDIVKDAFVQIAGVGVQGRCLTADRLDHMRVAMADMRDVVVAVQILFSPPRPRPRRPLRAPDAPGRRRRSTSAPTGGRRAMISAVVVTLVPLAGMKSGLTGPAMADVVPGNTTTAVTARARKAAAIGRVRKIV